MGILVGIACLIIGVLVGLEASRLTWQPQLEALEVQLRRANEELKWRRGPRLQVVPHEPGDAA